MVATSLLYSLDTQEIEEGHIAKWKREKKFFCTTDDELEIYLDDIIDCMLKKCLAKLYNTALMMELFSDNYYWAVNNDACVIILKVVPWK